MCGTILSRFTNVHVFLYQNALTTKIVNRNRSLNIPPLFLNMCLLDLSNIQTVITYLPSIRQRYVFFKAKQRHMQLIPIITFPAIKYAHARQWFLISRLLVF